MNIIEKQVQEFYEKFDLATIINDGVNPPYVSYKGAQTSSVGNLLYEIKEFLCQSMVLAMEDFAKEVTLHRNQYFSERNKHNNTSDFNSGYDKALVDQKTKHNEVLDKYRKYEMSRL